MLLNSTFERMRILKIITDSSTLLFLTLELESQFIHLNNW